VASKAEVGTVAGKAMVGRAAGKAEESGGWEVHKLSADATDPRDQGSMDNILLRD
jgi:hypothetical protein